LGGGWCAPRCCYPSRSDGGWAILCPHGEALGARLVEHAVVEVPRYMVAVRCPGTGLEGTAPLAVGLGEVQQQGSTETADHLGAVDQDLSDPLGVTQQSSEAGRWDDLSHCLGAGEWLGLPPLLERILDHLGSLSRVCNQFTRWHTI